MSSTTLYGESDPENQHRAANISANGPEDPLLRPTSTEEGSSVQSDVENNKSSATVTSCTISLINTLLGAGMLALPAAVASVGLTLGALTIVLAGSASALGLYFLGRCAAKTDAPSAANKSSSFFKSALFSYPSAAFYINLAIAIKCFGVGVSYLIIVGDLVPEILQGMGLEVKSNWLGDRRVWITACMFISGPLSFLKKLSSLRYTGIIAVTAVLYLTALVVWTFADPQVKKPPSDQITWGVVGYGEGLFYNLPIFVFAFTCHQNFFTIYNELLRPTQRRLVQVIGQSIGIASMIYETVGILGYLTFGSGVLSNLILMFDNGPVVLLGRILLAILPMVSFPLLSHPCRACLNEILPSSSNQDDSNVDQPQREGEETTNRKPVVTSSLTGVRYVGLTMAILICSYLLAISVSQLDIVLAFVGATGSTIISFILPGLFYWRLYADQPEKRASRWVALLLAFFGVMVMLICVAANIVKLLQKYILQPGPPRTPPPGQGERLEDLLWFGWS